MNMRKVNTTSEEKLKSKQYTCFLVLVLFLSLFAKPGAACNAAFKNSNGCVGDTIYFQSVDPGSDHCWNFGDTTSGTSNITHGTNAWHVFTKPGVYYVTLFVNIGAEFDYQTKILTIGGAACGGTDFTFDPVDNKCLTYNFNAVFEANVNNIVWDFGDPGSVYNTVNTDYTNSSTINVSVPHTFSGAGNYTVTLVSWNNDGTRDTAIKTITVNSNCFSASIDNSSFLGPYPCAPDTFKFIPSYPVTNPTFANWDFGDPSSGINNISSATTPVTHIYASEGAYVVTFISGNGFTSDTVRKVVVVNNCGVYPGDANNDGEVNVRDIFPIGIYYNAQGKVRANPGFNFVSQACENWDASGYFMYLNDLVNAKFADCDGGGKIETPDVTAITTNYGLKHKSVNNDPVMQYVSSADPDLYLNFVKPNLNSGDTVKLLIMLGTAAKPVNAYGVSLTIEYNSKMLRNSKTSISYNPSWLGTLGTDMISVSNNDTINGKFDLGMVRTDGSTKNGFGQIGELDFFLKDDISGKVSSAYTKTFVATINHNANVIWNGYGNNQQIVINVNLAGDSTVVTNVVAGVKDVSIDSSNLLIYPNPTKDLLNVNLNGLQVDHVVIRNLLGETLYTSKEHLAAELQFNMQSFEPGIYVFQFYTEHGVLCKKVNVIK